MEAIEALAPPVEEGKYDLSGPLGPPVRAGNRAQAQSSEVWSPTRGWTEVSEPHLGVWGDEADLTWQQKYQRWFESFTRVAGDGASDTINFPTPYGDRALIAPHLSGTEISFMLRVAFAAWYELPFYVEARDPVTLETIYAGHFGFVDAKGAVVARFPRFRDVATDHRDSWRESQPFPRDDELRALFLDTAGTSDRNPSYGQRGAGGYFDELFLNKRVGHFLFYLLRGLTGEHLAHSGTLFDIAPGAVSPGDLLLQRWESGADGNAIAVLGVQSNGGPYRITVAASGTERTQPRWISAEGSSVYFTDPSAGGNGENSEGDSYASLGGGIKRWRIAIVDGGYYRNIASDEDVFIPHGSDALAERTLGFASLLADVPPEEQRGVALAQIDEARNQLRTNPADCSARGRREDAFFTLYTIMGKHYGLTQEQVDEEYRMLEDYVLAELTEDWSPTCCLTATPEDFSVIVAYAEREQALADEAGACIEPTVFRREEDGYARYSAFAAAEGRTSDWTLDDVYPSSCGAATSPVGVTSGRGGTPQCERHSEQAPGVASCDGDVDDGDRHHATYLRLDSPAAGFICHEDSDWYVISEASLTEVTLTINEAADLDLAIYDVNGVSLGTSSGVGATETVQGSGTFYVEVYGYGAEQSGGYSISARTVEEGG